MANNQANLRPLFLNDILIVLAKISFIIKSITTITPIEKTKGLYCHASINLPCNKEIMPRVVPQVGHG